MLITTLHPPFQTPIDNQIDDKTVDPKLLLKDLLLSDRPLIEVAGDHNLSLQQLIVWIRQPGVQALLDESDAIAARIAQHKAAQARPGAVHTLSVQTMLIETVKERETAAKACRAILRIPIRDAEPPEAPIAPIATMRIPRPPRPARTHSPNPRRPRDLIPTDPAVHENSLKIPVYAFRPDTKAPFAPLSRICPMGHIGPMTPMSPMGPIGPIEPYELLEPAPPAANGPPPGKRA